MMAPAASEEQHVASMEEDQEAAKIKEVLSLLEPLHARISALLDAVGSLRVMGDLEQRCLAMVEMELRDVITSLKMSQPPVQNNHGGSSMLSWWLHNLSRLFTRKTNEFVQLVDPRHHRLLRRAAQCFRRSTSTSLSQKATLVYAIAHHPSRYTHLLLSNLELGLPPPPPRATEASGLHLFGIDRPMKKLLRWLTPRDEMDKSLKIMSIVGPAGVGKTTLAIELHNQLMCQTSRGHYDFQCNAMAQVSRRTNRKHRMELLLQDILSQISDSATPVLSTDQSQPNAIGLLVHHVSERLQDKRYFIIIDDIWEAPDWTKIKGAFPNNNLESRILITTRIVSIAWSCCFDFDGIVHEMKPLNEIDSERLLLTKAFGYMDDCPPHNEQLICDDILRRCEGIPLFITGMANWLTELQQRQEEVRLETLALYSEEQDHQLLTCFKQALSTSYDDLPYELSLLSLYMSMLPHGYMIDKDRLIRKWIQEGLVYATGDTHKKQAEKCFFQLVNRNVITRVVANCRHNSEAEGSQWQVNHFMMQFLASKAAEVGFVCTTAMLSLATTPATSYGKKASIPRRLALHNPNPQLPSLLQTIDLSQTHSLAVSGAVSGIPLEKFVNLVVLDLEGWNNLTDENLRHVCRSKMLFLMYLSIRKTRISKLPPEIKELWNMRVLDVSYTQISELPFEVFGLKWLCQLDLRGTQIRHLPKQIVDLHQMRVLLLDGERMINSTEATIRVPHNIWQFYWLETLATIDLSEHPSSFIESLGELINLSELAITWSFHQCTDEAYREALLSSIQRWRELESLTIHCGLGCSMEFLGSLSHPPKKLERFKVTVGRFATVPPWVNRLEYLSFVQITINRLGADNLKILRDLPKLQYLILGLDFIPEEAIVIENVGFLELQRFSVDCPLPWLTFKTGAMRKLTYLQLEFCACPTNEASVPSSISNLQSLTEVALCYNIRYANSLNVKMTIKAVREAIAGHDNQIDLFINGIQDYDVHAADKETESATQSQAGVDSGTGDDAQAVEEIVRTTSVVQSEIEADCWIKSSA